MTLKFCADCWEKSSSFGSLGIFLILHTSSIPYLVHTPDDVCGLLRERRVEHLRISWSFPNLTSVWNPVCILYKYSTLSSIFGLAEINRRSCAVHDGMEQGIDRAGGTVMPPPPLALCCSLFSIRQPKQRVSLCVTLTLSRRRAPALY